MLGSAWPAFTAFFFGEAFLYLGQYWAAGASFWRALASPSDLIFFKPVSFATSLPWYFLLPPDPLAYHLRNFTFSLANVVLLHRILVHLVRARPARLLGLALFVVSKVHLTTIGYVMIFDSIIMLLLVLTAALFAVRWTERGAAVDAAVAMIACTLAVFTKDYGVAAVAVVLTCVLVLPGRPPSRRALVAWGAFAAAVVLARLTARAAVVGPMPWWHPVYAPAFSAWEVVRKGYVFLAAATNTAFAMHDRTGASGIGTVAAALWPGDAPRASAGGATIDLAEVVDAAMAVAVVALAAWSVARVPPQTRRWLVPLVWIGAFFAPPLLTRNAQIYYAYEPLAGAAVLLALALDGAPRRVVRAWAAAVLLIAAGGVASNHASLYDWQFAARQARTVVEPVVERHRDAALDGLVVVADDVPFWRWTLTADDKAPMLPALIGRPGLAVRVVGRDALPIARVAGVLAVDADAGFAPLAVP